MTSPYQPLTLFFRFTFGRPDPSSTASREGDEESVISSRPLPVETIFGVSRGNTESNRLHKNNQHCRKT